VPFPEFLTPYLKARIEKATQTAHRLLFTSTNGQVLRRGPLRRDWWNQAAKNSIGQITPHELRHTAASLAISHGANVLAVSRMLGHADVSITLNTYAGLFEEDLNKVADMLNESAKAHIWHTD